MAITSTAPVSATARPLRSTSLYKMVWKWHFFAALYVLPFMALLSVTGGMYLFEDSIEEVIYKGRLNVPVQETRLPVEAQVAAVTSAQDKTRIRSVSSDDTPGRSTLIEYQTADRTRFYAWVDPYTGEVIATEGRDSTFMRQVRKLHGELLMGKFGTKLVELAAHWAIVLFITGLYLWWPRGERTWRKAFSLPAGKGRSWWKQTHMIVGFLASLLILPILFTGLPWTDVWGGGLDRVQEWTKQASPSRAFGGSPILSSATEGDRISYQKVIEISRAAGAPEPYTIRPPKDGKATYFVTSDIDSRSKRVELHIDQYNGSVVNRVGFEDYPPIAAGVSLGIAFHQGELYGWLNKAQNLLAATLGFTLAVSGFIAWWKRRPQGAVGVPPAPAEKSVGPGMIIVILFLGFFLPLMGLSLLVVLILDKLIFQRFGWLQAPEGNESAGDV